MLGFLDIHVRMMKWCTFQLVLSMADLADFGSSSQSAEVAVDHRIMADANQGVNKTRVSRKEGSNRALDVGSTHRTVSQGWGAENAGTKVATRKKHNPNLSVHTNLASPLLFQPGIL